MIRNIRSLSSILLPILMGTIALSTGLRMISQHNPDKHWLCLEQDCTLLKGYVVAAVAVGLFGLAAYKIFSRGRAERRRVRTKNR